MGPNGVPRSGKTAPGSTLRGLVSLHWEYLDGAGKPTGRSQSFPERDAAEEWLGQAWQELADAGVTEVELRDEDGGETLYRMALGPG